jgi:lysozyme family protein
MTVWDYRPFVERMIQRYEGGYGWSKDDPGGPTKFGITAYDLAERRGQAMDSMARWAPLVQQMRLSEADSIYAEKYATACRFNDLQAGCDCVVFDFGVNSGPSRAVKTAQHICGVAVDGVLGSVTLEAINAYSPATFVKELCDERLAFLRGLSIWSSFGRGWSARVADLRAYSLGLLKLKLGASLGPQEKLVRIPLAFAKGYAPGDGQ